MSNDCPYAERPAQAGGEYVRIPGLITLTHHAAHRLAMDLIIACDHARAFEEHRDGKVPDPRQIAQNIRRQKGKS